MGREKEGERERGRKERRRHLPMHLQIVTHSFYLFHFHTNKLSQFFTIGEKEREQSCTHCKKAELGFYILE